MDLSLRAAELSVLIEDELMTRMRWASPRMPESRCGPVVKVTADLAAAVRIFNLRLRSRLFTEEDGHRLISAAESLIHGLTLLGGTPNVEDTLAEHILDGALLFAAERFPELLPDDMR